MASSGLGAGAMGDLGLRLRLRRRRPGHRTCGLRRQNRHPDDEQQVANMCSESRHSLRIGPGLATVEQVTDLSSTAVIVPTYNRGHALENILRPLMDDPTAREVIVVIDGSTDDSLQVVQALAARDSRVRALPIANSGEMAAREAGARAADSEIVLFLDDDVLAEPGLVAGHAARHADGVADLVLGYMPVELAARPS